VAKEPRDVIDGLFAFVGVLTPDGVLVEANRAALQAAGLRPEDVIGLPFEQTYWWSYSPEAQAQLRAAVGRAARGESCRFDALNRVAEDRFIIVDFMLAPLFDERGRVTHLIPSGVDITERKRSEEALRESEKRFRATFEQAAVGVAHVAPDGRCLLVNQKLCDIVGYTRDELLARSFQEITHAEDLDADLENARRLLSGEIETYSMDKRYVRKDGCVAWINLTGSLVRDDATAKPLYCIAVVKDISARKEAEERIQQQAALLDVAHDAILVRDLEDHILYWNRGAERLYGWTAEEAVGRQADELLFGEPTPQLRAAKRALLRRGEWSGETHQVTKDGRDIIVESRWTLVRDESGRPRAKLVVNTDVTEKRRLESELLRASHLSLIGELAAGLAHEIKNPLAGIKGAVDILIRRREPGDPEVEVLEDVRHAVDRIDKTVLALLQRARPRRPQFAAASLDEAAHRAVLLARHHAARASSGEQPVNISFEPPPEPVVLPIDAAQIEDAVLNLILNAVEAVEGGGRVFVSVRRDAPRDAGAPAEAVIEVSDTGRGIDEENLTRVFSPFYTTTESGTGLGLPSVRRIAQAHGGRVEVSSVPGRGSTFTVRLPLPTQEVV
jgi:PAS domain S-box-containing protein